MYKNQTLRVLDYLEKYETITTMECFQNLAIVDLQKAICNLRQDGYKITDKWITKQNAMGRNIKYKEYRLEV